MKKTLYRAIVRVRSGILITYRRLSTMLPSCHVACHNSCTKNVSQTSRRLSEFMKLINESNSVRMKTWILRLAARKFGVVHYNSLTLRTLYHVCKRHAHKCDFYATDDLAFYREYFKEWKTKKNSQHTASTSIVMRRIIDIICCSICSNVPQRSELEDSRR